MENPLSYQIIGAAIEVHKQLGPGLLESAYDACLAHEMQLRGIAFERQIPISIMYKGQSVDCGFRIDLLVGDIVIVELKAVELLAPTHEAQVLTYLKLTGCKLGLLMNFNVKLMQDGIKRIAYHL